MSKIQKLKDANLSTNTKVTLTYQDGDSVVHCHDDYEDTALMKTNIASYLSEMAINPSLGNNHVIQEMRANGLLEEYNRGDDDFESFVSDVVHENWREYDWIETSTEIYDHKRGFTTVSACLETTLGAVTELADFELAGWNIQVDTPLGSLEIID